MTLSFFSIRCLELALAQKNPLAMKTTMTLETHYGEDEDDGNDKDNALFAYLILSVRYHLGYK